MRVRSSHVERLGELLNALVEAGSNRIFSVTFEVETSQELLNESRKLAIADARQRAGTYAAAAGAAVGEVLSITEHGATHRPPSRQRMAVAAAESVPISPGQLDVGVSVTVVFTLQDR